jgi:glycosyltransferase involved in cell wall biosynthesis
MSETKDVSSARLTVVVPVYNNRATLAELYRRLNAVFVKLGTAVVGEVLFVDDGSEDGSLDEIKSLADSNDNVGYIQLTRNFGSSASLLAGLESAKGDLVGSISADLQDPPEIFLEMHKVTSATGNVVIGIRRSAPERTLFTSFFYFFMSKIFPGYPEEGFDVYLGSRAQIKALCKIMDKNVPPFTMFVWAGFPYSIVRYDRVPRRKDAGRSQFTFAKKIKFFVDCTIALSVAPIRIMSAVGLALSLLSFGYGLIAIGAHFLGVTQVPGWTSLMILTAFGFGIVITMLGVIGEYIWRILDEVRSRRSFVVRSSYDAKL